MIVELQIFKWRIVLTAAKTEVLEGVYSTLDNDMHFLMWDFDDMNLKKVVRVLQNVQENFALPTIHILETKKDEGYHAYCLYSVHFQTACAILASTEGIDMRYYSAGVIRHKWTLRLNEKSGRIIKPICTLRSSYHENVKKEDINRFCHYKAPGDNHKTRIFKLGAV